MLNEEISLIYENFKTIQFKNKKICKEILEKIYMPQQKTFEHLYRYLPSLKKTPKRRLEIIDGYNSYVFDVDRSPSFVREFIENLELEIKHGKWSSQESMRKIDRLSQGLPMSRTKMGKNISSKVKDIFKKFK